MINDQSFLGKGSSDSISISDRISDSISDSISISDGIGIGLSCFYINSAKNDLDL